MDPRPNEFDVPYSGGKHPVKLGQTVRLNGINWLIHEPDGYFYSPSSIGGVMSFRCIPLGKVPSTIEQYVERDGTVVYCGDTIAAQLARGNPDW